MDSSVSRFLHFEVSGNSCALPISSVREVLPMATLTRPPQLPSLIEGFLNIGGKVIPVIRLDRVLALPPQPADSTSHLIWLREENSPGLLLVQKVHSVLAIAKDELLAAKNHQTFNDCVVSLIKQGEAYVHVLSLEKLLLAQERKVLNEFSLQTQKRLVIGDRESA